MVATTQSLSAERARFHHVRLNVTDVKRSIEFYQRIFGAVLVQYANTVPALFTERSFILLNEVDSPAPWAPRSGIWHYGWGGVDVPNEYEWFKKQGVTIHTSLYSIGPMDVMYMRGPDDEIIEVNTEGHHRFCHVHLLAEDVNATTDWYRKHLGMTTLFGEFVEKPDPEKARAWLNFLQCDNIRLIVYGMPNYEPRASWWQDPLLDRLEPSDGRVVNHIAFSYRDIDPVYARMKAGGVEIVDAPRHRPELNHRSFFARGPDKVLIEIVEAKPVPDGIWDQDT